jgi:hypothetical protein
MGISDPSREQLKALWDSGVPLESAWDALAVLFDRLAQIPVSTRPTEDPGIVFGTELPRYPEFRRSLRRSRQARVVTSRNKRLRLFEALYAEHLWAIGFRTLSVGSEELMRLPRQHFQFEKGVGSDIRIDWDTSELTVGATTYGDIRVVPAPTDPAHRSTPLPHRFSAKSTTLAKRKIRKKVGGRENTSREVRRITRQQLSANPGLANLTIKQLVGHVRKVKFRDEKHEEKGYKFSSMSKWIGQEVSAFRKRDKRNKPNKWNKP